MMLEISSTRKNKVNLSDYNCKLDIDNRSLLSDLSFFEHEVLQEIFFSSLKFSLKKIARSLRCEEAEITPILIKLSKSGLLSIQDDTIVVDKEMRKFFEFHMKRFDPDFKPDMEYLQGIMRKVPIHVLPSWYAIPRTSNNIFESIVEKYLFTPQSFQRYLSELSFTNPIAICVMNDVFASPDLRISSTDIITKYNLTRQEFEEILLILEFSFVACVTYTKGEVSWLEWVTPFHEWQEYILFFKKTEIASIPLDKEIIQHRKKAFSFVENITLLLQQIQKSPFPLSQDQLSLPEERPEYISYLVSKLLLLQLATIQDSRLYLSETSSDFLELTSEKKALYIHGHPLNQLLNPSLPTALATEKNIRDAEKSIKRVLKHQWVFFDEFIKGSVICLNESNPVCLQRIGKTWKYTLPTYNETEVQFIKLVIFEWLVEVGIVSTGTCEGRDCFTVTPFGRLYFED